MSATVTLDPLTDFSDRLSPMVVKELRQGLRTRMFALVMLVLHVLLIFVTLINGVNTKGSDTSWMLETLSILCLCIILPLRGFSAVADEIQRNTLDMLVLTRLSAVRIVFGKWISIVLQSLLVALSLMPYVVASYVYGGTDLVRELELLALKWLIGIVVAAAIVCLSTQRQFGLRAAVVALALLGPGLGAVTFGVMWRRLGSVASRGASWPAMSELALTLWIIEAALWLIFAFLSLGATRIAPVGSNLALVKRPVHAGMVLVLIIAAVLNMASGGYFLMAASTVAWFATLDAMVERENSVPSTLAPFYRRGWAGRVAGWFLLPGWPNGMFYSVLLTLGLAVSAFAVAGIESSALVWLSVADAWLCAVLLHLVVRRRDSDLLTHYICLSLVLAAIKMFVVLVAQSGGEGVMWVSMVLPGTVLTSLEMMKLKGAGVAGAVEYWRLIGLGCSCVWPLILGWMAVCVLRRSRPLYEEARRMARDP